MATAISKISVTCWLKPAQYLSSLSSAIVKQKLNVVSQSWSECSRVTPCLDTSVSSLRLLFVVCHDLWVYGLKKSRIKCVEQAWAGCFNIISSMELAETDSIHQIHQSLKAEPRGEGKKKKLDRPERTWRLKKWNENWRRSREESLRWLSKIWASHFLQLFFSLLLL